VASSRIRYAPKVPVGWIVQLYRRDALGIRDAELLDKVGHRLFARCQDVLRVSQSRIVCPSCDTEFSVPWIGEPPGRVAACLNCEWSITAGEFHASFEHRDLWGINAHAAFSRFVTDYPRAEGYQARMLSVDRIVHALHTSGNFAARNILEGRPRQVLATLDALASKA
jgi:hypothetical protein